MLKPARPFTLSVPMLAAFHYESLCTFFGVKNPGGIRVEMTDEGPSHAYPEDGTVVLSIGEITEAAKEHGGSEETEYLIVATHEVGHVVVHDVRRALPELYDELISKVLIERGRKPGERLRSPSEALADFISGVAIGLEVRTNPPRNPEKFMRDLVRSQENAGCVGGLCSHQSGGARVFNLTRGLSEGELNVDESEEGEDDEDDEEVETEVGEWTNNGDLSDELGDQEEE